MEFAKDFFIFLFSVILGCLLLGLGIASIAHMRVEKNCIAYGKLTEQEVAQIGMNCYDKRGFRVL